MLPKPNRLSSSHEIIHIRSNGRRIAGQFVTCFILTENLDVQPRITFVVSKRISKLAVARNRTKRLLGESVRPIMQDIKPGTSIVCLAKIDLSDVPLQEITKDVQSVFYSANLTTKP